MTAKSFEEAVKETIVITRVQEPNMENHEKYKDAMNLYLNLIGALTPVYNDKWDDRTVNTRFLLVNESMDLSD